MLPGDPRRRASDCVALMLVQSVFTAAARKTLSAAGLPHRVLLPYLGKPRVIDDAEAGCRRVDPPSLWCDPLPAQPPEPRVHSGRQLVVVGDPAQQRVELLPLLDGERGADLIIVLTRDLPDPLQCVPAGCGQVERIGSPIPWILAPGDQSVFLQFIHKGDQPAG
jgi:hypothetical protein